jgi:hypothetical protein
LIDLRAELESFFREAGVTPVLSDSLTSDFEILPNQNSIETCLANVRGCDAFVIVLPNRYGPSLAKGGFDDVSATHLEYREAVRVGIPVHMYVRGRLEGEYSIWHKNRGNDALKLSWCKNPDDWRIFALLEQHRELQSKKPQTNWIWTFQNSIELKQRIAIDFRETFARVTAARLFEKGRLPFFEILSLAKSYTHGRARFPLRVRNISGVMAVHPIMELGPISPQNRRALQSLAGNQECQVLWEWAYQIGTQMEIPMSLRYSILEGHDFKDSGCLQFIPVGNADYSIRYLLKGRTYEGASPTMMIN